MEIKKRILLVDDERDALKVNSAILSDDGYEVYTADNGADALNVFEEHNINVVLADLKMPGMSGMELLHKIKEMDANVAFIIMTAYGSVDSAVSAMKEGAIHYLIKPINYDELDMVLGRIFREQELSRQVEAYRYAEKERANSVNFVGNHSSIQNILRLVRTVAATDAPVLIWGETGTGKEVIAQYIHSLSTRSDNPMITVNSAALNENLLESELFGYVKGAFTNALNTKKGRLEIADHGTLFLDEISRMSLGLQSKLLRFLQQGTFEPVGSNKTRKVDVRIIAATNRDLYQEIQEERFLSDLLYRLDVISIHIPPLRERGDDVLLLARYFIKKFSEKYHKDISSMSGEVEDTLLNFNWPGNVRQLENYIERGVIMSQGNRLEMSDLSDQLRHSEIKGEPEAKNAGGSKSSELVVNVGTSLKDMERELIRYTLINCHGNKSTAASILGITRKTLYEKIETYGINIFDD